MSKNLTPLAISNKHRPKEKRFEVPDGAQRGLHLVVQPTGRKGFCVRYRLNGLPRKLTLKSGLSLADARKAAADAMYEIEKGRDPSAAKKEAKAKSEAAAVNTVQFVCEQFLKREGDKLRTIAQREAVLKRLVYPALGKRLISDVKRSEINKMLDKIEDNSGKRSADLALQYLRRAMNWHAVRDDNFRSPFVPGMGRYDTAANARSRVLNDDELRTIWKASEANGYFGALVRFLLLTGARRGEAAGLRWGEIDGSDWKLPASRNKNKTDLLRPLSKAALAVIDAQPRIADSPYVFTFNGRNPISFGRCKRDFEAKCGITADWRLHDLRRTARTLLSRAGINADIAERCLGHSLGPIRAVYDRHSFHAEMVVAFEVLAAQIEHIVAPQDATVVPMVRQQR
jgi:integrase